MRHLRPETVTNCKLIPFMLLSKMDSVQFAALEWLNHRILKKDSPLPSCPKKKSYLVVLAEGDEEQKQNGISWQLQVGNGVIPWHTKHVTPCHTKFIILQLASALRQGTTALLQLSQVGGHSPQAVPWMAVTRMLNFLFFFLVALVWKELN